MKEYKIGVSYQVYGYIKIEADSLESAIDKAWEDDCPLPDEADYIDGSWEVDEESAYFLN